jgi:TetR/AcrR family tetracycline transcriptional repressor
VAATPGARNWAPGGSSLASRGDAGRIVSAVSTAGGLSERGRLCERDVIDAALRLTRRNGLAQLSMRSLAEDLGVATMASYYYVPNKEALLDLVANKVLEMVEVPPPSIGDWAERVGEVHRRMHHVLLDYPGLGSYLLQRPLVAAGKKLGEATQELMREGGLSGREAQLAATVFQAFLLGRLSIESAAPAQRHDERAGSRRRASHRSADEVFEYGIAQLVVGLRAKTA